jgi:hypothetical protein
MLKRATGKLARQSRLYCSQRRTIDLVGTSNESFGGGGIFINSYPFVNSYLLEIGEYWIPVNSQMVINRHRKLQV